MRAMRAETFSGYEALKLVEVAKPTISDGRVLVRITTAGVAPLDFTILSGKFSRANAPLILGNEGTGVVTDGGGTDFPVGSRVMFTGPYGVAEDGTYSEWIAVRKQDLCSIPDNVDDVSAAGVPVAYLTAHMTLTLAGFHAGKTVLAPAIGGSVGNAVTQLARALGAKHAISSTTNYAKAKQSKVLGFNEVIDTSSESLTDGVRRITDGYGADVVIDAIGGKILGEALGVLALGGKPHNLGIFGRPRSNYRCDKSHLATGEYSKFFSVCSTTGGLYCRLELYRPSSQIRRDQTRGSQNLSFG